MPDRKDAATAGRVVRPLPNRRRPWSAGFATLLIVSCGGAAALNFSLLPGAPLVWFVWAPVLRFVVVAERPRTAATGAFLFCAVWFGGALAFLLPLSLAGWAAAIILETFIQVFAFAGARFCGRRGPWSAVFGTAAVWATVEIVRTRLPIVGFPWALLGHALADDPALRQNAELLGVFGLSFLVVAVNGVWAFLLPALFSPAFVPASWSRRNKDPVLRARVKTAAATVLLLFGAALLFGGWRRAELRRGLFRDGPAIAALQGVVWDKLDGSDESLESWMRKQLSLHEQAARPLAETKLRPLYPGERPALICWAETMVPGVFNNHENEEAARFLQTVKKVGLPAACGSDFIERNGPDDANHRSHNSAFLFDGSGRLLYRYDKRRLVPFGEYVPWRKALPFLDHLNSYTRDRYDPGTKTGGATPVPLPAAAPVASPAVASPAFGKGRTAGGDKAGRELRVAFNLCIEDAHPDLAREAAEEDADLLLNLTNDGWFGGTFEPELHLRAALWRAVEVRRPLLRVTNTGITALVDPLGEVEVLVPEGVVGVGRCRVPRLLPAPPRTLTQTLGEGGAALIFLLVAAATWLADAGRQA